MKPRFDDDDLVNTAPKRSHIKKNRIKDRDSRIKDVEIDHMHQTRRSSDRDTMRKVLRGDFIFDEDND